MGLLEKIVDEGQFARVSELAMEAEGLFTDEHKLALENGVSMTAIIGGMSADKQAKLGELFRELAAILTPGQISDIMFLDSDLFYGIGADSSFAILRHLKASGGVITPDDLLNYGHTAPATFPGYPARPKTIRGCSKRSTG